MKLTTFVMGLFVTLLTTTAVVADPTNAQRLFDEMDCELGDCCAQELQKTTSMLKSMRESIKPLKAEYNSCKSQLASLGEQGAQLKQLQAENSSLKSQLAGAGDQQQKLEALLAENSALKAQLDKGKGVADNAVNLALYAKQLEGKITALNEQIAKLEASNQRLTLDVNALTTRNAKLSQGATTQVATTQVVQPLMQTETQASAVVSPKGKIVGKILSLKRETNARSKKDQLVIGVSLTNTTGKPVYGLMVGPEITAIDNNNNMFASKDAGSIKGITSCYHAGKLYNEMGWCEKQIAGSRFSTTSFRPGVAVNILATIPAISADPEKETSTINTTLFLLLESDDEGVYEKFPVDIRS